VNSSARILRDLFETLLTFRVRPYYLHQGDLAGGTAHLRTPLEAGIAILEALRGTTSGLAIPHLAVDLPGGGGKVTLQPEYRVGRGGDPEGAAPEGTWLRNGAGRRFFYPEPPERDCTCPYEKVYYATRDGGRAGGRAEESGEA
jgi:lysine 2,3-aminomutase